MTYYDYYLRFKRKITSNKYKNDVLRHIARIALYETRGEDSLFPMVHNSFITLRARMKELGMPVKLSEGFRTAKKQNEYYSRKPKITNAKGLQSYHQWGLAMDVIFVGYNWKPPSKEWWDTLGREGKKLGLEWGGDWKFKDQAHFEYHPVKELEWRELKAYLENN